MCAREIYLRCNQRLEIENSAYPFEMRVSWALDMGSDFAEGAKLKNKKAKKIESNQTWN